MYVDLTQTLSGFSQANKEYNTRIKKARPIVHKKSKNPKDFEITVA
jgi:hypothetical protein